MEELLKTLIALNNEKIHTISIGKAIEVNNEKMTCTIKILQFLPFRKKLVEIPEIFDVPLIQPLWNKQFLIKAPFEKGDKFIIGFTQVDSYTALESNEPKKQDSNRTFSIDDAIILHYLPQNSSDLENQFPNDLLLLDRKNNHHIRLGDEGINILGNSKFKGDLNIIGAVSIIGDVNINGVTTINGNTTINGKLTVSEVVESADLITPVAAFNTHFHLIPNGQTSTTK